MVRSSATIGKILLTFSLAFCLAAAGAAQNAPETGLSVVTPRFLTVASTTSTQDSGLFNHILPQFKARTGIEVKIVSQGTGQALDTGRRGDADVVFVHARAQELKFVEEGHGAERKPVMYNDFVLIGPRSDPAGLKGSRDIAAALRTIAHKQALFVSRADRSGTHTAELSLWKSAGIEIETTKGLWYREIGQGMGAALNTAGAMAAYVVADRATWLSFRNRDDLDIMVEGDVRLFNQYGVILVNAARHPHIKAAEGRLFVDWLVSAEGQRAIGAYTINGERLFFPNATQPGA